MSARPTLRFFVRHPAHVVALGFGAGLIPFAPGTFGTLVAVPLAFLLQHAGDTAFVAAIIALLGIGTWAADVTGRDLGVADHGAIVIDEIAAFLLVLFFVGTEPVKLSVALVLFRLFDIWKPTPIRELDARVKGGIGVMLDDLAAAGYTLLVMAIGAKVFAVAPA